MQLLAEAHKRRFRTIKKDEVQQHFVFPSSYLLLYYHLILYYFSGEKSSRAAYEALFLCAIYSCYYIGHISPQEHIARKVVQYMGTSRVVKLKDEYDFTARKIIQIRKGDYTEIKELAYAPYNIGSRVCKLNEREYLDKETGEIKTYSISNSRGMSKQSLKRTINRVHDAVLCNCSEEHQNRLTFITLTFGDDVTDCKAANKAFDTFSKRFSRYVKKNHSETYNYIRILEPQIRGTWHFHVLLIWSKKAPFIENKVIEALWGNGYTKTTGVRYTTPMRLAEYLTAHIRNMTIEQYEMLEQIEIQPDMMKYFWWLDEDTGCGVKIELVKDGRVSLYPKDAKIISTSQGIKRPKKREINRRDLKAKKEKAGDLLRSAEFAVLPEGKLPQDYADEEECVADAKQLIKTSIFKKPKKKRPVHDINYASLQKDYNQRNKK